MATYVRDRGLSRELEPGRKSLFKLRTLSQERNYGFDIVMYARPNRHFVNTIQLTAEPNPCPLLESVQRKTLILLKVGIDLDTLKKPDVKAPQLAMLMKHSALGLPSCVYFRAGCLPGNSEG